MSEHRVFADFENELLQNIDALLRPTMLDKRCASTYLREVGTALHRLVGENNRDQITKQRERILRVLQSTLQSLPPENPRREKLEKIREVILQISDRKRAIEILQSVRAKIIQATVEPIKPQVPFSTILQVKLANVLEGNNLLDLIHLVIKGDHGDVLDFCFQLDESLHAEVFSALHELYPGVVEYLRALEGSLTPQYNLKTG